MNDDKLINWLCMGLVIMGFIMTLSSLWMIKQLRYYEAMENEYLKVIKEYHQSNHSLIKLV